MSGNRTEVRRLVDVPPEVIAAEIVEDLSAVADTLTERATMQALEMKEEP